MKNKKCLDTLEFWSFFQPITNQEIMFDDWMKCNLVYNSFMAALTPKVYWVWCKTVSTTIRRVLMMGLQCKTEETRNHSDIIENKTCAKSDQVSRNEKAQWIPLSIINWKVNTCACYSVTPFVIKFNLDEINSDSDLWFMIT